jgi:adenosylcobinamide-GDP ribazoletransferase
MIRTEIRIFLTAVMFFTRIPVPAWVGHSQENLERSSRYLPLMGLLVGGISAAAFYGASLVFSRETAVVLALITGVLLTGAFHEDGFADFCDGFGGGWSRERILEIMRDSRIGAFGTIGLILLFLLKYHLILEAGSSRIPWLLISVHMVSRITPCLITSFVPYAREDGMAKPVARGMRKRDLLFAAVTAAAPLLWMPRLYLIVPVCAVLICTALFGLYIHKWIGGFTGDCLGALQQISEVVFLAFLVAVWTFL